MSTPTLTRPAPLDDQPVEPPRTSRQKLTRFVWRLRLSAVCICLSALAFIQDPGWIASDTKLDLAINPGGLMSRAMHLWDPSAFSGSLQNQAYGYLWPMGPYYWLTETIGIPSWVAQRMWWSLLLCLAFLGTVRLARLLNLGPPPARLLAGLAYALSPMMLSKIGPISSEVLPIALAPWVLIPLVAASKGASIRKSAALSGIAIFCIGGINAAATIAILPLGLIWILTRTWCKQTRALLGWWVLAVALASLWWAIPLVTLGRYSPPFLDWIEAASITTNFTDPASTLRGTPDWIAYLADTTGPVWQMGWEFVTNWVMVLAIAIIAAVGIAGLALRRVPHRSFLIISVLAGFALVSLGHVGELTGLGSQALQDALNGVLVPFRNVHKFDPVIRLPLALGVAIAVSAAMRAIAARRESGWGTNWSFNLKTKGPIAAVILALGITVIAVLTGPITYNRSFLEIPDYWKQSAQWLQQQHEGDDKALVIPGASFAQMLWGRPQDEPYQALGGVDWDVRDAVPLADAGHTRMLDVIAQQLETGRGSDALAAYLKRSGYSWLVMRNDIDTAVLGNVQLSTVHQALANSSGITKVQEFGPTVFRDDPAGNIVDYGLNGNYPAIEIFAVDPDGSQASPAVLRDASHPVMLDGTAEATYRAMQQGVATDQTVLINGDPGTDQFNATTLAADTGVKREINFGFSRDNASDSMKADQPFVQRRKAYDYLSPGQRPDAFAELDGVKSLSASSSGSAVDAVNDRAQGATPFAAIDGDPTTSWHTGTYGSQVGSWWRVDFLEPMALNQISIRLPQEGTSIGVDELDILTSAGSQTVEVDPHSPTVNVNIDQTTNFLAIRLKSIIAGSVGVFGIADVSIPQVTVKRPVKVDSSQPVQGAIFNVSYGDRDDCMLVGQYYRCSPQLGMWSAERSGIDRWVWLDGGTYRLQVGSHARAGQALDQLLVPLGGIKVEASSSAYRSPLARPQAAADGLVSTAWQASPLDAHPWLELTLPKPQTVRGIQITNSFDNLVSDPIQVRVTAGDREITSSVGVNGVVPIGAIHTSKIRIDILGYQAKRALSAGQSVKLPVGIGEVTLLGEKSNPGLPPSATIPFSCGFGPSVVIDGKAYPTAGQMTFQGVFDGAVSPMSSCGKSSTVALSAGWHRIQALPNNQLGVDTLSVLPAQYSPASPATTDATINEWDATQRSVSIDAASNPRTLETTESYNPGWVASVNGQTLQPVQVDGWRQAWMVPAGVGGNVDLTFAPDSTYRWGLLAGLLAVLALIAMAVFSWRSGGSIPVRGRKLPVTTAVIAGLVLLATGGFVALIVGAAAAAIVVTGARRNWPIKPPVVVGALAAAALAMGAVWTWPDSISTPWLAAVIQGAMVFASLAVLSISGLVLSSSSVDDSDDLDRNRVQMDGPRE